MLPMLCCYFNSIKVQLELEEVKDKVKNFDYFNSIKVQLEHVDFQSQVEAHLFQFHKGTIRTPTWLCVISSSVYFNSIKVQLELVMRLGWHNSVLVFQFHKGTIRTYSS